MKKTVIALLSLIVLGISFQSKPMDKSKLEAGLRAMESYLKSRPTAGPQADLINTIEQAGTPQQYMEFLTQNEAQYADLMDKFIELQEKVEDSDEDGGDISYRDDPLIKFFEPVYQ